VSFFDAFGVDLPKLIFQIVNFLLLLYLANRFAFKPVLRILDERSARIAKGLEDAEAAERDRQLAQSEREAAITEARKEAQALLARAAKIAEDTRAETVAEAKAAAEKLIARAHEEITAERDKAMSELKAQVADLALDAASKLVRSEMNTETQRRLVDQFLSDVQPDDAAEAKSRRN
jgi:F-type H+-transporting ATPase subunit b